MLECTIDFNVNDRPSSIRALIQRLNPVWALDASESVRVNLARCRYLGPDGATILGAVLLRARGMGHTLEIVLPAEPPQLRAFCEYSGLNEWVLGRPPPDITHPNCVTVPLRRLDHARHQDAEPIFRLIRAYTEVSEAVHDSLGVAFTEVVQNVEDHARSPVGAVSCARYMTSSHEVRVAIVDLGEGIGTTLRRAHPDTRDTKQALARVLEGGYTARSRRNNMGQGVSNLRLTVAGAGGTLHLLSEDAAALVRGDRATRFERLPFDFPGPPFSSRFRRAPAAW